MAVAPTPVPTVVAVIHARLPSPLYYYYRHLIGDTHEVKLEEERKKQSQKTFISTKIKERKNP